MYSLEKANQEKVKKYHQECFRRDPKMTTNEKNMSDIVDKVTYPVSLTLATKETIKKTGQHL